MSIAGISFPEIDEFLTDSIIIESQSEVDDGKGGETTSWITQSIVEGKVSPLNGREVYEMQNINPEIDSKIFLKKGSVVTTKNRISVVSSTNSVVNGTFDTDSNWVKGAAWSISDGKAVHTSGNGITLLEQSGILTIGKKYLVSFDVSDYSGSGTIGIETNQFSDGGLTTSADGSLQGALTTTRTALWFFGRDTTSFKIDNVVMKEVVSSYDILFVKNPVSANEFLIAYTKSKAVT